MDEINVTFDARKVGGPENPIAVHPAVLSVPFGEHRRLRFRLRTLGAKTAAVFDAVPAFFSPGAPLRFEDPVPLGSTSFCLIDENRNRGPLPQRVYCTLWVRYEGQCYPALYPTILNEPQAVASGATAEPAPALLACAA